MPQRFLSYGAYGPMFKGDFRILLYAPRDCNPVCHVRNGEEIEHTKRVLLEKLPKSKVQNGPNFEAVL